MWSAPRMGGIFHGWSMESRRGRRARAPRLIYAPHQAWDIYGHHVMAQVSGRLGWSEWYSSIQEL